MRAQEYTFSVFMVFFNKYEKNMAITKEQSESIFRSEQDRIVSEWKEFLRFKSISTDPTYNNDCTHCATWLCDHLKSIGFQAELIPTISKPLVYAELASSNKNAPTVLFYGHYDVQPVDPLDAWTSPPFEPEVRNGRMYARGAEDNKGQVFYFIKAVEALIKNKVELPNLKILIEGEEESGGKAIAHSLPSIAQRIRADILMVCDTGTMSSEFGTITMGLRGIVATEVRLDGPKYDLHSGVHGGVVPNPATAIARIVASLHNADGSVAIEGFNDSIRPYDPEDLKLAESAPFDLNWYQGQVGVAATGGEKGRSFFERRGFRPTVEINGIHSGYGGPGAKTIIPSYSIAKISARLVAGQDPAKCITAIEEHIRKQVPEGLRISFISRENGAGALSLSAKSEVVKKAKAVLDQICPKPTVFMWEGASVPIIPGLAQAAGAEPLLVGFGMEEDLIHAPNESFSIEQFRLGFLYVALFLQDIR